jgi:hypothetical protein
MLYSTSIHTWPQNLDLAQIEAIVQEIEQEKEAGKAEQASNILNYAHNTRDNSRGGEEALKVGGYRCGPSSHGNSRRGYAGFIGAIVVSCNYTA